MTGVLSGIRVLDFGHWVAGPLTSVLLADQGADVIRIDRPGDPRALTPADAFLNRGKRRITLDLKDPADLAVARELAERADVLIENFRPGVMDRLGLGFDSLAAAAPHLVYCSIPGFSKHDPRAGLPGWEGIIAAATGNCRVRYGEAPADWDWNRPTFSALPMASNFASFLSGFSILAALRKRHLTGQGEHIEVPLFNATFELIGGAGSFIAERGLQPEKPLDGNGSGTYECGDGRWVQFNPIGASARFLGWFLDAAGEASWAAEGLTSRTRIETEPGLSDLLRTRLNELFRRRPAKEWEDLANAAGVPLCMIRTTSEWSQTEHARSAEQVVLTDDPVYGPTWLAGRPVRLSSAVTELGPRELPDGSRDEILAELAQPRAARTETATQRSDALPYEGVRVLDLTQILAGPSAGRMLGEFGAEVFKFNSPQRKIDSHGFVNRGKRTVLLDLESPRGQELLWALLADADVVTVNFPRATANRYGLGYEHLRARKPDIVYVQVSCYGNGGPWESRRGYETQGQASTGVMERAGRGGKPGVLGPYNLLDYGTGSFAAFAASLGLYHQAVTGQSLEVATSLSQVGVLHQATLLVEPQRGSLGHDEPAGRWALGSSPWQRFYEAADGWFFLGTTEAELATVATLAGVEGPASNGAAAIDLVQQGLEAAFAQQPLAHWTQTLVAAGIGAHRIVRLPELMADATVQALGLSIEQLTEEAGRVVMPGPAIRLADNLVQAGFPARRPGSDAPLVLSEIGMADQLDQLSESWVVQINQLPPGWDGF